ncbi:MAG: DUF2764 family protein [Gemmatimonadota bacterium]
MDSYYYLVAQLPLLRFDAEPGIGVEAFLEETEKWLPEREQGLLCAIVARGIDRVRGLPPSLWPMTEFEIELRDDVGRWRQARHAGEDYRPRSVDRALLEEGTPLDVERNLMRLRWSNLQDYEGEHHFDYEAIIIYLCKLLIARRLHSFNREEGMRVFRQLCEVEV